MSDSFKHEKSDRKSWIILLGGAFAFLVWGLLLFIVIGDKGPPVWDFSVIEDIPGQSAYSVHGDKGYSGKIPKPQVKNDVFPQHVMEPPALPFGVERQLGVKK